jgi:hypothetical protein
MFASQHLKAHAHHVFEVHLGWGIHGGIGPVFLAFQNYTVIRPATAKKLRRSPKFSAPLQDLRRAVAAPIFRGTGARIGPDPMSLAQGHR